MKLVIVRGPIDTDEGIETLRSLLTSASVAFEVLPVFERPAGAVIALPCIAAIGDDGRAVRSGGEELAVETLQAWAAEQSPVSVAPSAIMSKTSFNIFGWMKIGMAAFQKVLEDTRKSTGTTDADYEARAAVSQYDGAQSFEKSQVEVLGAKIVAAGYMTQDQYNAMTGDNWPPEGQQPVATN